MAKQPIKTPARPAAPKPGPRPGGTVPAQAAGRRVPAPIPSAKPPAAYDYGAAAGAGAEDISADDMLLPFVRILQSNSPQINKHDPKYIEKAEAGMFFNVSTNQLYSGEDGFTAHLCYKTRSYAEFIPRDDGGGFVGQRPVDDPVVVDLRAQQGKFGKLTTDKGTELTETYYAYAVLPPAGNGADPELVVFPFASTGITPFKQFLMQLNPLLRKGVPIYAPRVRLRSRSRTNKEGTFFVPLLTFDGARPDEFLLPPGDPLLATCDELRKSVVTGAVKVDYAKSADDAETDAAAL